MTDKKKKKTYRLKIVMNITILFMAVIVIVLLGSFIYRVFFTEQIDSSVFERENEQQSKEKIQISILNACGVDGLAAKAKQFMFRRNFDVVNIGNFDSTVVRSFIIDRVGNRDAAERSAESFGINDSLIVIEIDSSRYLMNTIVIGKDYKYLKPFKLN